MRLTAEKSIGTSGLFTVGYRQSGRLNAKSFLVMCGSRVVYVNAQGTSKARAVALAERCDRLVNLWRRCLK